jgi:hypothetical protein
MSVDYTAGLAVGYYVSMNRLEELFFQLVPECSHKELRYSEKTGEPIGEIEIIDQKEDYYYVFEREIIQSELELFEKIAEEVGCCFSSDMDGHENYVGVVFGVPSGPERIDLADMPAIMKRVKPLKKKLMKLGIMVDDPAVFSVMDVG